jgi:hypothetical protein
LINWELPLIARFSLGPVLKALLAFLAASFRSRTALQLEILALRHQIGVLQRSVKRPKLTPADRLLWAWLCAVWGDWQSVLSILKASTVLGWHRKGFRLFWTWKIRHGKAGRPSVPKQVRELIRTMSRENPLWGLHAFTANCSSSASISVKPAWASTWFADESRHRRPGGRSSTIT